MKVTIAKSAGFCMGVRRAVEIAFDAANDMSEEICTYGPLIHNPQVLDLLKERGISVIERIPENGKGVVIIRAHGVPPAEQEALKEVGFKVVDATCPRVIRVQSIISKHARRGYSSIIVGDSDHPEVKGLLGYAGQDGHVVDSIETLERLPDFEKAIIVAQTTQNTAFFEEVRQWAQQHHPGYKVFDTICDSTEKRQAEVKSLTSIVDAVIVVGGYNSGNTKRLAEIAGGNGKSAMHVEKADDIIIGDLAAARHIGITAGASTPNWIIKQVYQDLEARLMQKGGRLRRWGFALMRTLTMTNLYLAAGAGSLAFAGTLLQELQVRFDYMLIAALYILSMHTVNNTVERNSDRYNDPFRAEFYQKNRYGLLILAVASSLGAMAAALHLGLAYFAVICSMIILGALYNWEIINHRGKRIRSRLKHLPGSRTMLTALAWATVTTLLPSLHSEGSIAWAGVLAFLWVGALVLVRTAYLDIIDLQGSRIAGRETIPILLGEKRTMKLLRNILVALALVLPAAALTGIVPAGSVLLSLCPVAMLLFIGYHDRGTLFSALRQGFVMESHFVLAGVLSLAGYLFF